MSNSKSTSQMMKINLSRFHSFLCILSSNSKLIQKIIELILLEDIPCGYKNYTSSILSTEYKF